MVSRSHLWIELEPLLIIFFGPTFGAGNKQYLSHTSTWIWSAIFRFVKYRVFWLSRLVRFGSFGVLWQLGANMDPLQRGVTSVIVHFGFIGCCSLPNLKSSSSDLLFCRSIIRPGSSISALKCWLEQQLFAPLLSQGPVYFVTYPNPKQNCSHLWSRDQSSNHVFSRFLQKKVSSWLTLEIVWFSQ